MTIPLRFRAGRTSLFLKMAALVLYGFTAAAVLLWLPNLFLAKTPFSLNDLHLRWLIDPGRHFTSSSTRPGYLCTNPELALLDNGTECFTPEKKPGTFRIFCVGGSTTRGWPFQHVISYPAILASYLKQALPGRNIEVINAGFMSSDSFSDLPLVRELSSYDPDLFLIYEGRNDAINYTLRSDLIRGILKAHFFLLRNSAVYGRARALLLPDSGLNHAIGFRLTSLIVPRYRFENYKPKLLRNINEMRSAAGTAGAKSIFFTQVFCSQKRIQAPEITNTKELTDGAREFLVNHIIRNEGLVLHINNWLREFSMNEKVSIIDMASLMEAAQKHRGDLLIPPPAVHPDIEGYYLIARNTAIYMKNAGIPAPTGQWTALPKTPAISSAASIEELRAPYMRLADFFSLSGFPAKAEHYRLKSLGR